jgi:ABC-type polysaccharide/polyol phosphate transport system ATPase subunit
VNAIEVNNLGKKFKLFTSPGGRFLEYMSIGKVKRHADFWALKDISFNIPSGTTLGILGQNGSGKSTLLSILAGVLYPSEGSFEIKGKVSAILELGSGFHPEFSGRDNVYMYGSIMGLSKQQIDDRFDEIVQFSELGDFIDQPLRTYSSGMIVRLAFSVAVHVDADILIVDEALAVGDAIFQHRCFRKIREMQAEGKTILYVGHDTEAVRNLCTQALLLDGGRIIERGDPNYVVNKYYALIADRERAYKEGNLIEHGEVPGDKYETVYDFIRNLSHANIENAEGIPVQPQTIEIQSTPRRVIFAHPPSRITYTVPIEPESSLAFAIGILPDAWDKIPQGVKFDIEVISDGATETLFSRVLQPKRNIGDRGWHNFILPLEKFSGKNVTIALVTTGSGNDLSYGWSAWGWINIKKQIPESRSDDVVQKIKSRSDTLNDIFNQGLPVRYGNNKIEIIKILICDSNGNPKSVFLTNENIVIKFTIKSKENFDHDITVGCTIKNKYSVIYGMNSRWQMNDLKNIRIGEIINIEFLCCLRLGNGVYSVTPAVAIVHSENDIEILDRQEDQVIFKITNDKTMEGFVDLDARIKWNRG